MSFIVLPYLVGSKESAKKQKAEYPILRLLRFFAAIFYSV